jgi:hypothetical protein
MKIPQVKKKISSFLLDEDGKISKQSILTLGSIMSVAVIGGVLKVKAGGITTTELSYDPDTRIATGMHTHHASSAPPDDPPDTSDDGNDNEGPVDER